MFRIFRKRRNKLEEKVDAAYNLQLLTLQFLISDHSGSQTPQKEAVADDEHASIDVPTSVPCDLGAKVDSNNGETINVEGSRYGSDPLEYFSIDETIEHLDSNYTEYYTHIRNKLLIPINFRSRRVYYLKSHVEELAYKKKMSNLAFEDMDWVI